MHAKVVNTMWKYSILIAGLTTNQSELQSFWYNVLFDEHISATNKGSLKSQLATYVSIGYHSGISHLTTCQMDITVAFHIYRVRIVQRIDEMVTRTSYFKAKDTEAWIFQQSQNEPVEPCSISNNIR